MPSCRYRRAGPVYLENNQEHIGKGRDKETGQPLHHKAISDNQRLQQADKPEDNPEEGKAQERGDDPQVRPHRRYDGQGALQTAGIQHRHKLVERQGENQINA